jgi:hypothetical protein
LHHHAWHIRTVGLDVAAIESIALTWYRAGGALGASDDCTVCLRSTCAGVPLFLNNIIDFFHSFDYSSFYKYFCKLIHLQVKYKVHSTIDIRIHILL